MIGFAVKTLGGIGIGQVVGNVMVKTLPANAGKLVKVASVIGSMAIAFMIEDQWDKTVDGVSQEIKEAFKEAEEMKKKA